MAEMVPETVRRCTYEGQTAIGWRRCTLPERPHHSLHQMGPISGPTIEQQQEREEARKLEGDCEGCGEPLDGEIELVNFHSGPTYLHRACVQYVLYGDTD